jgi:hypothetical protein
MTLCGNYPARLAALRQRDAGERVKDFKYISKIRNPERKIFFFVKLIYFSVKLSVIIIPVLVSQQFNHTAI